jgi:hypothetical protein
MNSALPPYPTPTSHAEAQGALRGAMAIREISRKRLTSVYKNPFSTERDKDQASQFFAAARADLACVIRAVEKMLGKSYGLDRPRSARRPRAPVFHLVDPRSQ